MSQNGAVIIGGGEPSPYSSGFKSFGAVDGINSNHNLIINGE